MAAVLGSCLAVTTACPRDPLNVEEFQRIDGRFGLISVDNAALPALVYRSGTGAQQSSWFVTGGSLSFIDAKNATYARALRVDSGGTTRVVSDSQTVHYRRRGIDLTFPIDSGTPNEVFASGVIDGDTLILLNIVVRTPSPLQPASRHAYRKR